MRQVLKSDEIAQAWARQTQPSARCSAAMSFDGPKFYSYSTIVAAMIQHDGKTVFLITDGHYSDTTSRHVNRVRCAVPKGSRVFTVPGTREGGDGFTNFARILKGWQAEAQWLLEESAKAREPKKTRLIVEAYQVVVEMREFAAFFTLPLDEYPVLLPMSEQDICKIIRLRKLQAIKDSHERKERAALAKRMRKAVPRLMPGTVVTARDVYQTWQAMQTANTQ